MSTADRWEPILRVYCPLKAGSIDGTDTRPHDRAVERALKSIYKPNKAVQGDPECTLFVGRLDPATTEEALNKIFSKYGDIVRTRLVRDIVTGMSKQYAFIEYTKPRYASRARRDANHMKLDGHEILVEYECERTLPKWIPRRLGGGFGGKKESGQLRFGGWERQFHKPIVIKKTESENKGGQDDRYRDRHRDSHSDRHGDRSRERHRVREGEKYERQQSRERDRQDRGRGRDKGQDRDRDRDRYDRGHDGNREKDRDHYSDHRDRDRYDHDRNRDKDWDQSEDYDQVHHRDGQNRDRDQDHEQNQEREEERYHNRRGDRDRGRCRERCSERGQEVQREAVCETKYDRVTVKTEPGVSNEIVGVSNPSVCGSLCLNIKKEKP